ncbi:MAG TPA: menaquinone biosynthesis protein [Planctomycetota bacterium]|nr:menaquinone biosynthesis protein [Planctomycetota bacterium]
MDGASRLRPVKVGGIDYLNALPLTRYLDTAGDPPLEVSSHPPSALARLLRAGDLDVALVPVVEYLARPEYRIVPDVCIASYGEVLSILFCHRRPLVDVRAVGLDESSRTSAMLTRLLFQGLWGGSPEFVEATPAELGVILRGAADPARLAGGRGRDIDALLLIGDAALRASPGPEWEVIDLGAAWTRWTGLPLVYAFWVWRGGPAPPGLAERFQRAKAAGIARIDEIVAAYSAAQGVDPARGRRYLYQVIQYDLGDLQVEGLLEFYRRLDAAFHLAPAGVRLSDLQWLDAQSLLPAS